MGTASGPGVAGVTIGERTMRSESSGHTAEWREHASADGSGGWVATMVPGRLLSRVEAEASVRLAELVSCGWDRSPAAAALRAQLGL
jgi:hypothetical protein